ncbi:MAG: DUF4926 domain-containing protein [Phormidesmis sp. CAN_BIN36]|nr:DUF4926 domain-containing protein [Phormidesmis sp. CAN_BIN36]
MPYPKLLDTVAVLSPLPRDRLIQVEPSILTDLLPSGLIGTVVETYDETQTYLVEFSDAEGCEYAMAILPIDELLVVHLELTSTNSDLATAA